VRRPNSMADPRLRGSLESEMRGSLESEMRAAVA
jgi:hypothetical protein